MPPEVESVKAKKLIQEFAAKAEIANPRVVVSAGRLREHKGFQHVIEAIALVRDEFPDLIYVIVGAGPHEATLREKAAQAGVEGRVLLAGMHRPPDAFLSLAEIFVTVTWEVEHEPEGFGMVFIEAGRYGVPSIAGNIGGMPEAVLNEKTGLTVRPASPVEIADALRRLLGDPRLREQMGQAAANYAREFEPVRVADIFMSSCGLAER
jgi:phosphatidylinositol alpha-1,6-mannosyltransferase